MSGFLVALLVVLLGLTGAWAWTQTAWSPWTPPQVPIEAVPDVPTIDTPITVLAAMGTSWAVGSWEAASWADGTWADLGAGGFSGVGHINDRITQYVEAQHIPGVYAAADLMTLVQYDVSLRTGSATDRFLALISDASA